jgi:hypothetical protein
MKKNHELQRSVALEAVWNEDASDRHPRKSQKLGQLTDNMIDIPQTGDSFRVEVGDDTLIETIFDVVRYTCTITIL